MRGFIFVIILLCSASSFSQALQTHKKIVKLMGCRFELTAVAFNDTIAWEAIRNGITEIDRIEKLISSWDKNSQTSKINQQAGIQSVKVDKELFNLIARAKKISQLTDGAFDISFASMDRIWKFDGSMQSMPDESVVKNAAEKINWQDIIVDAEHQTIFLKRKNMKIGFGAIGKGYAANRAMHIMKESAIEGGVVNASGDLISWGKSENPHGWTIKIADPKDKNKVLGILETNDLAVVTSGDYEKFVTFNGRRYAHIIDPRTGYPTTGIKSVTVICPDAEVADALATSVFVLGKEEGINLINRLKAVECLIVTDDDEVLTSKKLKLENL
ncbi:MAG: thiamine biosynthesis lipoprotein [Granulosicoccus sp.]|jgi:thiamine biosynthesis lipoprotein